MLLWIERLILKVGQNRFWSWQKYHVFCCLREVTTTKFWILRSHKKTWQISILDSFSLTLWVLHSFTLKGLRYFCFPRILCEYWQVAASETKRKETPMCVLNSRSSKSFWKSPENYFCWGPIGSIFKQIPIAIFRIILPKLKHVCKR